MANQTTEATYKQVLTKKDLFGIAIGMIIGAGVMTLTGIGIGRTGRSVFISYLLATFFALFFAVPSIMSTSVARFKGGSYTTWSMFVGEKWSGAWLIVYFLGEMGICMYALSFAQYFQSLFPNSNPQFVAIALATVFFILNFFGINIMSKVENVLTVALVGAVILFIVCGMPHVKWDTYFTQPGFITNGVGGIMAGAAFLNYALLGASELLSFSAETKNPKKDIPMTIILSTAFVAVLFSLLSIVAAGVLPLDQVIGKPLTVVGEVIFSKPLLIFFIVAGALGATATTMNVTVAYITKPLVQASRDGWFPKKMGELHPKYRTPHRWLIVWYILCIIPLAFNFSVGQIADLVMFITYLRSIVYAIGFLKMPKMMPDQWAKSMFHMPDWAYKTLMLTCAGVAGYQLLANLLLIYFYLS
ncbi:MAG: amino acid permease [Angelakisella sp.]